MLIDAAPESPTRSVPAFFMQSRKMPRRFAAPMRHSLNHATRANAKRLSRGQSAVPGCFSGSARTEDGQSTNRGALNRPSFRPLPEGDLRRRHKKLRPRPRLRCRPRSNQDTWERYEADEALDLAHSEISLPCDRFRLVHPPPLAPEKEVSWLDAESQRQGLSTSTSQSSRHSTRSSSTGHSTPACDVDRGRDGDFSLDKIRHDEPVYFIRPQRRTRKPKKAFSHPECDPFLQLDLSFSDLGDDIAIAHLLKSSFQSGADDDKIGDSLVARPPGATCLPLRVVYELAGTVHSMEAHKTESHPERDSDLLSDYDYLSDSELVDDFTQHEVEERTGDQHTEVWIVLEETTQ